MTALYILKPGERLLSQLEISQIDIDMSDMLKRYPSKIEAYERWLEKVGAVAISVENGYRTLIVRPETFPIAESHYRQYLFWKVGKQLARDGSAQAWEKTASEISGRLNSK